MLLVLLKKIRPHVVQASIASSCLLVLTCLAERIVRILHAIDSYLKARKDVEKEEKEEEKEEKEEAAAAAANISEGERKRGQNSRAYPPLFC